MKDFSKEYPNYIRLACYALVFSFIVAALIIGRPFLVPFIIAGLLAFLLYPISSFMESKGVPKGIAIVISILFAFIVIALIGIFFYYQVMNFMDDGPLLREQLNNKLSDLQSFVTGKFRISKGDQNQWLRDHSDDLMNSGGKYISGVFSFTGTLLASLGIIPIYIFFLTYYREKFEKFIIRITPKEESNHIILIAAKTAKVSQKYLQGLLIDIAILSVLNSVGFLFLGLKYAILLGVIAAILNVIPYIGVLIGSIFPVLMAILTKDSIWIAAGAAGVCVVVQFLDNNFITPKVVGSSVSINPLATLMVLILGGLIWGVAGMMLFIPLLGMLKVIFDNFPSTQPYGYLIGNEEQMKRNLKFPAFKKQTKI